MESNGQSIGRGDVTRRAAPRLRPQRVLRTVLIVLVVFAVWAVAVTVDVVLVSRQSAAAQDAQLWDTERTLAVGVAQDFHLANYSTLGYLATGDAALGDIAGGALGVTSQLVASLQRTAALAFTETLNLTVPRLMCASGQYLYQWSVVKGNMTMLNIPFYQGYFTQVADIVGNVGSLLLQNLGPSGTDPLAQLGPAGIGTVAAQMGRLYLLSAGMGPSCGV